MWETGIQFHVKVLASSVNRWYACQSTRAVSSPDPVGNIFGVCRDV